MSLTICCLPTTFLQVRIEEVLRALTSAGLPLGPKASEPKPITAYPFHDDAKNSKVFWDVRRVGGAALVAFALDLGR